MVELNLVFLRVYQRHPNTSETRSTARSCLGRDVSSFNPMVYQVVKHSKIQPMVESWGNFVRVAEYRQIFLRPDMSSYAAENSNHIQPQVVLLCEHNTIMRILNKIQLMVEFSLGFQDFANII